MYFQTYEKTELKNIYQARPGERLWPFVEVGFPLPFYLMHLESESEIEDETLGYEIITANVVELINFADGRYPPLRLLGVDLLFNAPHQNRRTFHRLHEVWNVPERGALRFIVDDGVALDLDPSGRGIDTSEVKLLFQSPVLQPGRVAP